MQDEFILKRFVHQINRTMLLFIVVIGLLSVSEGQIAFQNQTWPLRNLPGHLEFPMTQDVYRLASLLSGSMTSPHDAKYANASLMWNLRVIKSPFLIVYPRTIEDVQRTVLFTRHFNLHLSIRSSGHSFIGRSTFDGSINLNMAGMKAMKVNLQSTQSPAGEITVQSGASWLEVYKAVNGVQGPDSTGSGIVGRVIVGGSAHTVAMGGYTQGGGHAPICRRLGLAVDNLLDATLVAADGRVMTVSADKTVIQELNGTTHQSSDTSLFWAIRGGGGGTWGIIISFTFKLHYAPQRIRNVVLGWPLFKNGIGVSRSDVLTVLTEVNKLTEDWGGYLITHGGQVPGTEFAGSFTLTLLHFGNDSSPSNKEIDSIIQKTSPSYKTDNNYATFYDYESEPKDGAHGNVYVASSFTKRSTMTDTSILNQFVDFLYSQARENVVCTMTMIGGKVVEKNKRPATPVHPGMRQGVLATSCATSWAYNPLGDEAYVRQALAMAAKLYPFGDGSYFNEPAEDMPDWKTRFWADAATYDRLLKVKQTYDPDNYFWCHNCVGSDQGQKYGSPFSSGPVGRPSPSDKYGQFDYTINFKVKHPVFTPGIVG